MDLRTTGLKHERQPAVCRHRLETNIGRQPLGIHCALPLHPRQRRAGRLGLDHPDRQLVHIQQVVRAAIALGHDHLADRDPLTGKEIEVLPVLDHPAGVSELAVDQHTGTLFSGETILVHHLPSPLPTTPSHYRRRPPG
jgi:hypothetical protein